MRFLPTDIPFPLSRARRRAMIAGLSLTQMTAWGTTFYAPSVLGPAMGRDIGISPDVQFGGVTVMLLVAAAFSPSVGRWIDRHGARGTMSVGSLCLAAALFGLSLAQGPFSYLACWTIAGLAVPLAMSNAAFAAVAQANPGAGRRPITLLMLMSGLSSGIYWPITGWLEVELGWRGTLGVFALVNLLISLPIHLALVRRMTVMPLADAPREPRLQGLPPAARRAAFWLVVVGAGISGLASWGIPLQFIAIFQEAGMPAAAAIAVASVQAPASLLARVLDLGPLRRHSIVSLIKWAALVAPLVFIGLALALRQPVGTGAIIATGLLLGLYGICTAMISAARATLPLELFGPEGYATLLGRLSLWLNILFALSPLLFAVVRQAAGAQGVLIVGLACSVVAAVAFRRLHRLARAHL